MMCKPQSVGHNVQPKPQTTNKGTIKDVSKTTLHPEEMQTLSRVALPT